MEIVVALPDIRSTHNVGSIFRTADAAGVKKVFLCGITPQPIDQFGRKRPDISKVALGAEEYIPWEYIKSVARLITRLKKEGYMICAVEQSSKSIPYRAFKAPKGAKIALIMGSEVEGLPKTILARTDVILEIPMFGQKESLNVGVAFGVVVFGIK
ncbi:MAG: tRNA/rRNA methyltransferase [uncultured bacterium]|uniref:tRNA/rRNA methyltransferase n=1 Tax=Candidatus Wolfebacteria bacterium GW2011_GWE2_44_13 TaxID=1619017 RepID=A0A0G1JHP7_9BACT|nr:MAG: tRNA/rRNA methyltransferase [uncultured bacterium]KKT43532.1 MAG: tRNA/rRNA methyltransferase [Candidatus Wolfebacteria bacterium GW2011_GWE2_44_13]